jgi:O-antigen/teichoic acid export membrane protein
VSEDSDEKSVEELLGEIIEKGSISIGAFTIQRLILLAYSFIVTRVLGAQFYGFLSVFTRGNSLLRSTFGAISTANERTIPRQKRKDKTTAITTGYTLLLILWGIVAILTFTFRHNIISITLLEERHTSAITIFCLSSLPVYMIYNSSSILRSFRRIRLAMIVSKIGIPFSIITSVLLSLIIIQDTTVESIWIFFTFSTSIITVLSLFLINYITDFSVRPTLKNKEVVKDYLRYTSSTIFVTILGLMQRRSVFVVMAIFLSPVSAGLFSLSLILAQISRWPLNGINQIFPAIATKIYGLNQKDKLRELYKRTSLIAAFASTPLIILIVPYHTEILATFSPSYASESIILPIIMLGQYIATIIGSVGLLILMTDNERMSVWMHVLHVIVILPSIVILTKQYGVLGLGVAYFISLSFNNITEVILLYHLEKLSPFTKRHLYLTILALLTATIVYITKMYLQMYSIPIAIFLTVLYLYTTYKLILDKKDTTAIKSILPNY